MIGIQQILITFTSNYILRSDEVNIEHNGLQNINRRIWLGYGGDSGLTIDSTEGEGFTVKLKLRLGGM